MLPSRATRCSECGVDLDPGVVRFEATCGAIGCRLGARQRSCHDESMAIARERDAQRRAEAEAREQMQGLALEAGIRAAGGRSDERVLRSPIPALRVPLVAQSEDRARAFLSHLDGLLGAEVEPGAPATEISVAEGVSLGMADPRLPPMLVESEACGMCRGSCCPRGGTHAFFDREAVHRYRAQHPDADRATILADFEARLPARVVDGSCVFHGAEGCALPRAMRSSTCNSYRCPELRSLVARFDPEDYDHAFLGAFDGDVMVASKFVDASGVRSVAESDPGPANDPAPSRSEVEAAAEEPPLDL